MVFVQSEFQQEFVLIKHEWRDFIEPVGEWHSAGSKSSSSTCGPSSASSSTSQSMQHEGDSEPEVFWDNLDIYDDWDEAPAAQELSPNFVPVTPPLPPPPILSPIDPADI